MHTNRFERVVVVGTSGSGKTIFARALTQALEVPHVELDALYWGPNWVRNSEADYRSSLASRLAPDAWVVDGNISTTNAEALRSATSIIWLNYSFSLVFGRAVRRTFRRILTREKLYSENRESIWQVFNRDWIPWWVIRTFSKRRREYRTLFSSPGYSSMEIVELLDPQAADRFLTKLRAVQQPQTR